VEREGLKGEKEVLAFRVFAFFLVLFCNVMCVEEKGFSFIHQPTIGYERQIGTDRRRRRVCFSTSRADLCIFLDSYSTSRLCKELYRISR
jgi:hypothetical protein